MATITHSPIKNQDTDFGAYLPTQEEIAEKTAEIRGSRLRKAEEVERQSELAAKKRLAKSREALNRRRRKMTKADICNVEPVTMDELYEALQASPVEEIDTRWAIAEEDQL